MNSGAVLLASAIAFGAILAVARADDRGAAQACDSRSASVRPLAKIVNTRDATFDCLGLRVDSDGDILGIRFEKHEPSADRDGTPEHVTVTSVREFASTEISGARGAVLDGVPGHDAVMLRGNIAARQTNVPLVLSFLYNGLTGEYRACATTLALVSDGVWRLLDARNRPVSLIRVRTRRLPVIGTIGIETIQGICADR